jgi:hypothetical protein
MQLAAFMMLYKSALGGKANHHHLIGLWYDLFITPSWGKRVYLAMGH